MVFLALVEQKPPSRQTRTWIALGPKMGEARVHRHLLPVRHHHTLTRAHPNFYVRPKETPLDAIRTPSPNSSY